MTLHCALCLHLMTDGRGHPPAPGTKMPDRSAAVTIVQGHASCLRHFPYLRWPRDLDESAQVALGDGIEP